MSSDEDARGAYEARRAELDRVLQDLEARSHRLSLLRGLTFLATAALGGYALFRPMTGPLWGAFSVALAAFVGLVIRHALLIARKTEVELRATLIARGLGRMDGDHSREPRGERYAVGDHAYAGDLDVFGDPTAPPAPKGPAPARSVFQLVSAAETTLGADRLAAWLAAPAGAAEVLARQEAARELAGRPRFREDLAAEGASARTGWGVPTGSAAGADPLLAWAEGPPSIGPRARPLVTAAKVLVPITVGLIALGQIAGDERLGPFSNAWLVTLVLQVIVLLALRPSIDASLVTVSSREAPFGRYRGMLGRVEAEPFEAERLAALRQRIAGGSGTDASREMKSLQSIIGYADLRHNAIIHVVVNLVLLWDVWCGLALDRWRERAGKRARGWLEALGEIEALASLGTFAHEHPAFAWPEVVEGDPRFEAEALGHPLIPADRRVDNDLALRDKGTALLVTGSNMSGKSTLLRSVGVNAALALAGAPVCARRLVLAPVEVRTSMRIKDSLEQGVSHFYAELGRLKAVVDAADRTPRVLFLLDEVLHGTNSRERLIGAKAILLHLVDKGAIGLASSHDLGLAPLEEESGGRVANVHFEELVTDGKMTFDYKLKAGVVKTANALRLMQEVGLPVAP